MTARTDGILLVKGAATLASPGLITGTSPFFGESLSDTCERSMPNKLMRSFSDAILVSFVLLGSHICPCWAINRLFSVAFLLVLFSYTLLATLSYELLSSYSQSL